MTVAISANPTISGVVLTRQGTAPVTPASGKAKLYVDTAGLLSLVDDAGAIAVVGTQGAPIATGNLLTNPGVDVWQRGPGGFSTTLAYTADGWQIALAGTSTISVVRDAANADAGSPYCAAVTYVHNAASNLAQTIESVLGLRSRTLTLSVRVRTATGSAVRLSLYDNVNGHRYSAYHTGSGAYETLAVTASVAATATLLQAVVVFAASCTAYVDSATLVIGAAPLAYAPLHPADEWGRCARYYEGIGGAAVAFHVDGYSPTATTNKAIYTWAYSAKKPITPTVTVSGTFALTNCSALQIANPSTLSCRIYVQVTAIGAFSVSSDSADDVFVAEANV